MTESQRATIRDALRPAIMTVFAEALTNPVHPTDDDDASGTQALFDNLALGIVGVANEVIKEYEAGFIKGRASVSAHAK